MAPIQSAVEGGHMALLKCKECGGQVSSSAKACPTCGAKPKKKTSVFTWIVAGVFGIFLFGAITAKVEGPKPAKEKTPEEAAADAQFAAGLRTARIGADALKGSMKDPDSFDLKSALVMPSGAVCFEYKATNSFNAKLVGAAVLVGAKMLVQERDGNAFVAAWNKTCTKAGGREVRSLI